MPHPDKPSKSTRDGLKRRTLYLPGQPRIEPTMFEAELADQIANQALRQLCIYESKRGFCLKALPVWKDEFMTLIGTATKEPRQYKSLDRLLNTIKQHGPLPPTLLLGEQK